DRRLARRRRRYRARRLVNRRRRPVVVGGRLRAMGGGAPAGRARRQDPALARGGTGADRGDQASGRSGSSAVTRRAFGTVLECLPRWATRCCAVPAGTWRRSQLACALVGTDTAGHRREGGTRRGGGLAARKGCGARGGERLTATPARRLARQADPA